MPLSPAEAPQESDGEHRPRALRRDRRARRGSTSLPRTDRAGRTGEDGEDAAEAPSGEAVPGRRRTPAGIRVHVARLERLVAVQKAALDNERNARRRLLAAAHEALRAKKLAELRARREAEERGVVEARSRRAAEALAGAMSLLSGAADDTDGDVEATLPATADADVREGTKVQASVLAADSGSSGSTPGRTVPPEEGG